ncbi:hypothetical protein [Clostridium sp. YIM B02555]|jgi:hypothetical protein|uniref:hypothetical protein n=1 Tax=Clostridium sp. YIM B02555 TaxID=2911968 RepID=UPI001EEDA6AB|nr:hypothetical protein [Clostridium sp. YIM B02555]
MLRLTVFEFIFRGMPEAFVVMFAMLMLSNERIDRNRYIISSLLLGFGEYGIRFLPISFGVHTILGIFIMIIIMWSIDNVDVIFAIRSSLILTITMFIIEGLNIIALKLIFKDGFDTIMLDTKLRTLTGIPSLIILVIISYIIYYLKKRKN